MKQFTLNGTTFIAVEVPVDSFDYRITYEDKYSALWGRIKSNGRRNPYASDIELYYEEELIAPCFLETRRSEGAPDLSILGLLSSLTDEQVRGYVEENGQNCWKDYQSESAGSVYTKTSALASFLSKLKAEGIDTEKNLLIVKKQ